MDEPLGVGRRERGAELDADRDDLEVGRRDGELLVRVGPYRRALVLPDTLKRRSVAGARLTEGELEVRFA